MTAQPNPNPPTTPAPAPTPPADPAPATGPGAGFARAVWIGFALITGVLTGTATGLLTAAGGLPIPLAIVTGGSAAAATTSLFITLVNYATKGEA